MSAPASVRVGLAQMRSGLDPAANADGVEALVRQAASAGARLIATPEATNLLQRDPKALRDAVVEGEADVVARRLADLAQALEVWIAAGSLMVRSADGRVANRSYVFGPSGDVVAAYDKIHLFDVELGEGEAYKESATVAPGARASVARTPFGTLGLSVCYDLRFPHLYRALAQAGADLLMVPAAFTRRTGQAHWETLLRARAIENGAFVLAAAQGGRHADGRATWGRSTVVGPWGEIVARLDGDEPGVLIADLDLSACGVARAAIPSLRHDRPFAPARAS